MSVMFTLVLLLDASASTTAAQTQSPVNPLDTVRCVREQITGSVARTRKVCHSLKEWEEIRENAQREARRIIQPSWKMEPDN